LQWLSQSCIAKSYPRTLIYLKIPLGSVELIPCYRELALSRAGNPQSKTSIGTKDKETKHLENQFEPFASPILRTLGYLGCCILFALSFVLVKKVFGNVYFDGSMHLSVAVALCLAAVLIWIGQWILLFLLGLRP
jgi:hypothetical protein